MKYMRWGWNDLNSLPQTHYEALIQMIRQEAEDKRRDEIRRGVR